MSVNGRTEGASDLSLPPCAAWEDLVISAAARSAAGLPDGVEAHLATCPGCRAEFETWTRIGRTVRDGAVARAAALVLPTLSLPGLPPIAGQGPVADPSPVGPPMGQAPFPNPATTSAPVPSSRPAPSSGSQPSPLRWSHVALASAGIALVALVWGIWLSQGTRAPGPGASAAPGSAGGAIQRPATVRRVVPRAIARRYQPSLVPAAPSALPAKVPAVAAVSAAARDRRGAGTSPARLVALVATAAPASPAPPGPPPGAAVGDDGSHDDNDHHDSSKPRPTSPPSTATPDPALRPTRLVTGRVVSSSGAGEAEVLVVAEPADPATGSPKSTVTEPGGAFTLTLGLGDWYVYAQVARHSPTWLGGPVPWLAQTLTLADSSEQAPNVELTLGSAYDSAVKGRVTDRAGRALRRSLVVALALGPDGEPVDPEAPAAVTLTDDDGRYVLYAPTGQFHLGAAATWHDRPSAWWSSQPGGAAAEPVDIAAADDGKTYDFVLAEP